MSKLGETHGHFVVKNKDNKQKNKKTKKQKDKKTKKQKNKKTNRT
jgi:hypothetical protein